MARERHLSKAPIEEAVIEIRVTPREGYKVESLEAVAKKLEANYPKQLVTRQFAAHVAFGSAAIDNKPDKVSEWLYGEVVQVNADLYSFSWLRPYETWEAFVNEARRNWLHYEFGIPHR